MATNTGYTAIVVTFRRAESLRRVLQAVAAQSLPPLVTVVADNDPEQSARSTVAALQPGWPGALVYTPVGENLGPAGGWAHAAEIAARQPTHRGRWLLVLDDDDPVESPGLLEAMTERAERSEEKVAAIGLRGARWEAASARLRRCTPDDGASAEVDYLASGGAPLYRWDAIDSVGFFHPPLFFGFEDLELGFRLGVAGWQVRVSPLPSLQHVADTAGDRTPWREYYKTRALVWILKRHRGAFAVGVTAVRSVLLGGVRLSVIDRRPALAVARWRGLIDGLAGRLGVRRYFPANNPAKDPPPVASGPDEAP